MEGIGRNDLINIFLLKFEGLREIIDLILI